MLNMSYCQFRNTDPDFRQCLDSIGNAESIEDLSHREQVSVDNLYGMDKDYINWYKNLSNKRLKMTKENKISQQVGYLFLGGTIPKEFFDLVKINDLIIECVYPINYGDDNVVIVTNESVGFIEESLINFNKEKVEYDENC